MKLFYLSLAFVCMALGAIGAFLPVLPTVPFLLLASWLFAKGSDRWRRWFHGTRLYRNHLQSFEENRAMTLRTKLSIVLPVTALLVLTAVLVNNRYMSLGLGALLLVKYWFFAFRIRTIPREKPGVSAAEPARPAD